MWEMCLLITHAQILCSGILAVWNTFRIEWERQGWAEWSRGFQELALREACGQQEEPAVSDVGKQSQWLKTRGKSCHRCRGCARSQSPPQSKAGSGVWQSRRKVRETEQWNQENKLVYFWEDVCFSFMDGVPSRGGGVEKMKQIRHLREFPKLKQAIFFFFAQAYSHHTFVHIPCHSNPFISFLVLL